MVYASAYRGRRDSIETNFIMMDMDMEKGKIILLVEDEAALQSALGSALRMAGFEVISAVNGEDAITFAKQNHPDIILLDLILPKRSGFEVLQELKADEKTKHIPVIVLTNLDAAHDVDQALSLGATTFLVKANYEINDVIEKLKQALRA